MLAQGTDHHSLVKSGFTMIRQLRQRPCSIYDVPDDGLGPLFSQTPTFSNDAVFTLMLAKFSPSKLVHFQSCCYNIGWALSQEQKQLIWGPLSQIRSELRADGLKHIAKLAPTRQDMHCISSKVWLNEEHPSMRYKCASYLDPTTDIGQDILTRGLQGTSWTGRLQGLKSLLAAVQRSGGVPEWIWAARLITARFDHGPKMFFAYI
ncbi:hypothetical protein DFS34DRAFT_623620 [Phlyctochytrium arcticum]|nr:hypothetical protein DFS34DRAFT_623620 [Phlyctochytrium arcticum]